MMPDTRFAWPRLANLDINVFHDLWATVLEAPDCFCHYYPRNDCFQNPGSYRQSRDAFEPTNHTDTRQKGGQNPGVSALFLAARGHFGKADMLRSRPGLQAASAPKNRRKSLILNKYLPT
jgi:hypothetical protein